MTNVADLDDEEDEAVTADVGNGQGAHEEKRPRASRPRKSS